MTWFCEDSSIYNVFVAFAIDSLLRYLPRSPVGWSGQGCYVKSMDKSQTECSCNHLTHFAVLMQFDAASGPEYEISEVGSNVTPADTWHIVTYSENFGNRRLMKYFSQCNTCKLTKYFFFYR